MPHGQAVKGLLRKKDATHWSPAKTSYSLPTVRAPSSTTHFHTTNLKHQTRNFNLALHFTPTIPDRALFPPERPSSLQHYPGTCPRSYTTQRGAPARPLALPTPLAEPRTAGPSWRSAGGTRYGGDARAAGRPLGEINNRAQLLGCGFVVVVCLVVFFPPSPPSAGQGASSGARSGVTARAPRSPHSAPQHRGCPGGWRGGGTGRRGAPRHSSSRAAPAPCSPLPAPRPLRTWQACNRSAPPRPPRTAAGGARGRVCVCVCSVCVCVSAGFYLLGSKLGGAGAGLRSLPAAAPRPGDEWAPLPQRPAAAASRFSSLSALRPPAPSRDGTGRDGEGGWGGAEHTAGAGVWAAGRRWGGVGGYEGGAG